VPPPGGDHYAVLEVDLAASADEIKAAYLRQVLRWHPDRNPSPEATRRTARINAAWEVLGDPARRAAYDRRLKRPRGTPARSGAPAPIRRDRPARTARGAASAPGPDADARARREAEARAHDAEQRRRRQAEYEQRRRASEHLWQPPPESGLGWSDRDFVVGNWYRNNRGPYKVIDVRDRWVDVYYADGEIVTLPRDDTWRHWQRQASGRGRPTRAGRPAARR
jgi:curved DNA-binding protein CbpA